MGRISDRGARWVGEDDCQVHCLLTAWPLWQLSPVPHCDNPDRLALDAVEEPVWLDDDLTVRQLGELWNFSARLRMSFESTEDLLRSLPEPKGCCGVVSLDIGQTRPDHEGTESVPSV